MTNKEVRCFNKEYLDILLDRDESILIDSPRELNGAIMITLKCKCNEQFTKRFRDIAYYGGAFCKECCRKNKSQKIKRTCLERYGEINPSCVEEIKEKKEESYLKHYGMHPKKTPEVQEKYRNTCLERYNTDNSAKAPEIKEKIKDTFNKKYGGHPMFDKIIKEKVKQTCIDRYGGYPAESQEVKDKMCATNLQKYGCHPIQTKEVKDKIISNNLQKYGCHPSQTKEIMEKISHTSKSYKKYIMPSGESRNIQGYEHFALDLLLKEYTEDQIITDRSNIPRIPYQLNAVQKYYFPDIYLPHRNLIIEVKSDWTYKRNKEKNDLKEKSTIEQGYLYELWIFDRKGIKL
jgi:hypothetical protein